MNIYRFAEKMGRSNWSRNISIACSACAAKERIDGALGKPVHLVLTEREYSKRKCQHSCEEEMCGSEGLREGVFDKGLKKLLETN